MGNEDQVLFEDDDMGSLDDFDANVVPEDESDDSVESIEKVDAAEQARINARHEIEKRNELKALKSELDEWDDLLDESVL